MYDIVAADIGGTSSRFAHFRLDAGGLALVDSVWLKTKEADSFEHLLGNLESSAFGIKLNAADVVVFAVAGPVERGTFCKPPSISWSVDLDHANTKFGIKRFGLINDFLAQAYNCRSPLGLAARKVHDGERQISAAVGVIGAGTGLGKALLLPDGRGGYVGGSSEGGHVNFASENSRELEFHDFVRARRGGAYATYNDIVSGPGLSLVHEFLTSEALSPEQVATKLTANSETLSWFSKFYATVSRNFALDVLAFGGLYIAGGVAAKNPLIVECSKFIETFRDSRVHRHILEQIPVYLVDNQESGLWGAAFYGEQLLR